MTKTPIPLALLVKHAEYKFRPSARAVHGVRSLSINSGINHGLRESSIRDARSNRRKARGPRERPRDRQWAPSYRDRISTRTQLYPDGGPASDDPLLADGIPYTTAASTFIFGLRNVVAALKAGRRQLHKLYLHNRVFNELDNDNSGSDLRLLIERSGVPVARTSQQGINVVKRSMLKGAALSDTVDNGFCLEASALPQPPLQSLGRDFRGLGYFDIEPSPQTTEETAINGTDTRIRYADGSWRAPFLIWLHGVVDAGNVGAIMRSALYFGADGIILSTRATASITAGVLKASAAAAEYLPVYSVTHDDWFTKHSKECGWRFYGAVAPEARSNRRGLVKRRSPLIMIDEIQSSPAIEAPCVLVLGNEETGLSHLIRQRMDYEISIPGGSELARNADLDSLNVSVAAALLCRKFLSPPDGEMQQKYGSETLPNERLYQEAGALP